MNDNLEKLKNIMKFKDPESKGKYLDAEEELTKVLNDSYDFGLGFIKLSDAGVEHIPYENFICTDPSEEQP